jgi:hypothetical protein
MEMDTLAELTKHFSEKQLFCVVIDEKCEIKITHKPYCKLSKRHLKVKVYGKFINKNVHALHHFS